jgi:hypothetical protein
MSQLIQDQREITACAIDIIQRVKKRRGRGLQPRDRMALKLLTPRNSALMLKNGARCLGVNQINFDILTDDLRAGAHQLVPTGIHVHNPGRGWWSDQYGIGRFLWNLYLKEDPQEGLSRILDRLFKFKMAGLFGPKARLSVNEQRKVIAAEIDRDLKLYIQREEGSVETTLRRMVKANAIHSPKDVGLNLPEKDGGQVVLLFGKNNRFGISFRVKRL